MKVTCLVVDDEPLAQKGLWEYIKEVPFLEPVAVCNSAAQAYPVLHSGTVDLMLLDIEMPGLSGIDFLKSLQHPPAVIFTTAYPEYAVQGYELDVIDYLVKPVSFQRFLKAVTKAKDFLSNKKADSDQPPVTRDFCFIKVGYQVEKINYNDILFIEALQNYVAIYIKDKKLISYLTLTHMEDQLPVNLFVRIHKSYIVSLPKIEAICGNKVIVGAHKLPVSRMLKGKLMKAVESSLVKR